jgi:hypothetical protein
MNTGFAPISRGRRRCGPSTTKSVHLLHCCQSIGRVAGCSAFRLPPRAPHVRIAVAYPFIQSKTRAGHRVARGGAARPRRASFPDSINPHRNEGPRS